MPLQRLQNRAARAITGIHDWNVQSTEIIKMLNWMSVRERYEYLSRVLMHKCIFKTSPSYLTSRFKYVNEVHPRHTRTPVNNLLYPPRPKLSLFKGSFTYSGSILWNSLPINIKINSNISCFKKKLKAYMSTS